MSQRWNIFYSWESDLPGITNRELIQSALERAADNIRSDKSINIEPVIDRDTVGVPGAPDIAGTIFAKIDQSEIFVVDVSIINGKNKSRKMPNPNVLIELGYALKALGPDRVIMVMNTAYGNLELLPFDLRMKRVVTYEVGDGTGGESSVLKDLTLRLEVGMREIIGNIEKKDAAVEAIKSAAELAIEAVNSAQANQVYLVRQFMKDCLKSLGGFAPAFPEPKGTGEPDDIFVEGIGNTVELVFDYSRVAEAIAILDTKEGAFGLLKEFHQILEKYQPPRDFSGAFNNSNLDFFKFIGHELYVTLISFLMRENRWALITDILDESILVRNTQYGEPRSVSFEYASNYVETLSYRKQRLKLKVMSVHAELLNERHTKGKLAEICSMEQFIAADYFLFVRAEFSWKPWSTLYMFQHMPDFVIAATKAKYATELLKPLGVDSIESLREVLRDRAGKLHAFYKGGHWSSRLDDFDYSTIGSK